MDPGLKAGNGALRKTWIPLQFSLFAVDRILALAKKPQFTVLFGLSRPVFRSENALPQTPHQCRKSILNWKTHRSAFLSMFEDDETGLSHGEGIVSRLTNAETTGQPVLEQKRREQEN